METIIEHGIEISKYDVTDVLHPIGYTYSELAGLTPPEGFEAAEPNDLMYLFEKGKLPNVNMDGYVYSNGNVMIPGKITVYASKCRNEYYPILLRSRGATFDFYPNTLDTKLFKVRWVKKGTHAPKLAFGGLSPSKWATFSDNLKIYLGYMDDPNIVTSIPLAPLVTGTNTFYMFPENYNGYRVELFVQAFPKIEEIYDETGVLYFSKTSHGSVIHENFIRADKFYTITVEA